MRRVGFALVLVLGLGSAIAEPEAGPLPDAGTATDASVGEGGPSEPGEGLRRPAPHAALRLEDRCAEAPQRVRALMRAERFLEAHFVAQTIDALCIGSGTEPAWRLWDAIALVELEDGALGRELLSPLASGPTDLSRRAATITAWSYLREDETEAFMSTLARVPPPSRHALLAVAAIGDAETFARAVRPLDDDRARAAVDAHRRYRRADRKSPGLAGTLSAVIPGLGQAYAGSWEAAAVALALNGILISSTVELARNDLYFTAGAAGTIASIFYVGSILNAADLASRRNERASARAVEELERALLPELVP